MIFLCETPQPLQAKQGFITYTGCTYLHG